MRGDAGALGRRRGREGEGRGRVGARGRCMGWGRRRGEVRYCWGRAVVGVGGRMRMVRVRVRGERGRAGMAVAVCWGRDTGARGRGEGGGGRDVAGGRAAEGAGAGVREGVDLEAEADDFFSCLREELALLALEEAARWAGLHERGRGREEGHELVAGGRGGELAAGGEGALGVEGDVHICVVARVSKYAGVKKG